VRWKIDGIFDGEGIKMSDNFPYERITHKEAVEAITTLCDITGYSNISAGIKYSHLRKQGYNRGQAVIRVVEDIMDYYYDRLKMGVGV